MRACAHTHTQSTAWAPVHSPSTGQCLCSQHKHAAFLRSLAERNLRERASAQQGGHEPSRDAARAEKGNRTQERLPWSNKMLTVEEFLTQGVQHQPSSKAWVFSNLSSTARAMSLPSLTAQFLLRQLTQSPLLCPPGQSCRWATSTAARLLSASRERINQITHEEKPFYQEGDQDHRDGGGSAFGDIQYSTGQCPEQAALYDHTLNMGL